MQDLRDALRSLSRNKAFTCAAISNLALGIGATTAIFTVVHAVVLQPLPFPTPDRLVQLYATPIERGEAVALADLDAFRRESQSFEAIAGYAVTARYVRAPAGSQRVMTVVAERSLFTTLGVAPLAGRTFAANDPANLAVISHEFWTRWFGGDPSAVGTTLSIDGDPFTVIGVMPASFQFPYGNSSTIRGVEPETRLDLWVPMYPLGQPLRGRAAAVGRLKPGVAGEAAESELKVIATRRDAMQAEAALRGRSVRLERLSDAVVAGSVRRPLFFLLAAVVMVLALACANVMNFSLVRMTMRGREVAVRGALGAGPLRLARQFLTESLLLSAAGGVTGFWMAKISTSWLVEIAGAQLPRAHEIAVDMPVFLFLLGVCAFTGATFGLAPALMTRHVQPQSLLTGFGGHSTMSAAQRRLRDGLVVAEVTLAFLLAMGATLLVRELVRLRNVDPGSVSTNVVTFHLGHRSTPQTDTRQFYEIADRVRHLPAVRAAGFTQMLPLQNWGWFTVSTDFVLKGQPPVSPPFQIELRYVTSGYFEAMGIPLTQGRVFADRDTRDAPRVIVINETLARRYFADASAVGTETNRGTIVGVVRDVRQVHLDRPANPEIYYPIAQNWSQVSELGMTLIVKTRERSPPVIPAVRSVVQEVNPNLAIFNIKTLDRVIDESLSGFTLYLWLIAAFAVVAIALACTGTYAVIAYVAATRTREFAIRLAIGADTARVTRLVLAQGARLTAIGLTLGLGAAFFASPLLQNLPVSVRPPTVATILPVAASIATVALLACLLPARRAARTDLAGTLRSD